MNYLFFLDFLNNSPESKTKTLKMIQQVQK